MLPWLPDWVKKWALKWAIGKFLAWLNALFSGRAAREVEAREKAQEELDGRPPDPAAVDSRLDNGSA